MTRYNLFLISRGTTSGQPIGKLPDVRPESAERRLFGDSTAAREFAALQYSHILWLGADKGESRNFEQFVYLLTDSPRIIANNITNWHFLLLSEKVSELK
ncbi:unnamed protein product [Larinioides sclopetarius]|uniref:Uncharacterized protein n=1 Tax=Larinioides sclopetarius TaxID=280406 RepID=A0AAV1YZS9_9ARAC